MITVTTENQTPANIVNARLELIEKLLHSQAELLKLLMSKTANIDTPEEKKPEVPVQHLLKDVKPGSIVRSPGTGDLYWVAPQEFYTAAKAIDKLQQISSTTYLLVSISKAYTIVHAHHDSKWYIDYIPPEIKKEWTIPKLQEMKLSEVPAGKEFYCTSCPNEETTYYKKVNFAFSSKILQDAKKNYEPLRNEEINTFANGEKLATFHDISITVCMIVE